MRNTISLINVSLLYVPNKYVAATLPDLSHYNMLINLYYYITISILNRFKSGFLKIFDLKKTLMFLGNHRSCRSRSSWIGKRRRLLLDDLFWYNTSSSAGPIRTLFLPSLCEKKNWTSLLENS